MKTVKELETTGAILIGCGILLYTLMLASVDTPVWEFSLQFGSTWYPLIPDDRLTL